MGGRGRGGKRERQKVSRRGRKWAKEAGSGQERQRAKFQICMRRKKGMREEHHKKRAKRAAGKKQRAE